MEKALERDAVTNPMRSQSGGIILQGPDVYPDVPAGATQEARIKVQLRGRPKHEVLIPCTLDAPAGWQASIAPNQLRMGPKCTEAFATVRVTAPRDAQDGQVWVRVVHDGAGASIGLPVHVVPARRDWQLVAAGATLAAAALGATAWTVLRRQAPAPKRKKRSIWRRFFGAND